jgi:hypothetical protein
MKTIKKAAIGLIFLAPLFLPAETKAGGFDDWFRNLIQERSRENHPVVPVGNDRYRSFNPYSSNGRPGRGPATGSGSGGNSVPIDGGLVFLLGAGLLLGAKTIYDQKRSVVVASC